MKIMPGTSAILTPFCKTSGLYFDATHEPEDFKYIFDKDIDETLSVDENCYNILPSFDSVESYFDFHLNNLKHSNEITMRKIDKVQEMYNIDIFVEDTENIE